jgi:hypothetical protein
MRPPSVQQCGGRRAAQGYDKGLEKLFKNQGRCRKTKLLSFCLCLAHEEWVREKWK